MTDSQISEAILKGNQDILRSFLPYSGEGTHLIILAIEEIEFNGREEIFWTLVPQVQFDLIEITRYLGSSESQSGFQLRDDLYQLLLDHISSPIELRHLLGSIILDRYRFQIVKKDLLDLSRSSLASSIEKVIFWAKRETLKEVLSRVPFSILARKVGRSYSSILSLLKKGFPFETAKILRQKQRHNVNHNLYQILSFAIKKGYSEVIFAILDYYPIKSSKMSETIHQVSTHTRKEILSRLISDSRFDPLGKNHALFYASQSGYSEIVNILLKDPQINPATLDNRPIIEASRHGHLEVVRLLLSNSRVDPSDQDNRAIIEASLNNHIEIVRLLLSDDRVNPSAQCNKAVRGALDCGYNQVVELLQADPGVESFLTGEINPDFF